MHTAVSLAQRDEPIEVFKDKNESGPHRENPLILVTAATAIQQGVSLISGPRGSHDPHRFDVEKQR